MTYDANWACREVLGKFRLRLGFLPHMSTLLAAVLEAACKQLYDCGAHFLP